MAKPMAIAVLCFVLSVAAAKPYDCVTGRTQVLQCNSINFKPAECDADGIITDVTIVQRHSKSPCEYGTGYGVTEDRLWVDNGCRATFKLQTVVNECSKKVTCSSIKYKPASCPVKGKILSMRLAKQLSKSACKRGETYGFAGTQVWVAKGCRATFNVIIVDVCLSFESSQVTCSSNNFKPASCKADGPIIQITVATQHSNSDCILDKSFGATNNKVWVKDGCRATFDVLIVSDECKELEVKCESKHFKYATCDANALIVDMKVADKHSQSPCVFNKSYGFLGKKVWVKGGCRATFDVTVASE